MDSFEKFVLKSLPEKNEFFSHLNGEISDEDFSHAKKVWEKMGIQNLGEYHDLYLKTNVFLLADVVENFRTVLLKNYFVGSRLVFDCTFFLLGGYAENDESEIRIDLRG